MLKMFSTQLAGLFKRIQEKQEFSFEDGGRLLAQAPAGDGFIYIFGSKEMQAVTYEALEGSEKLSYFQRYKDGVLEPEDRVLIFSRFSNDEDAVNLGLALKEKGISFVAVSTAVSDPDSSDLTETADVHIDLGLKKGLLPDEEGNRFGFPSSMAALFAFYGLKFTIEEILAEYE